MNVIDAAQHQITRYWDRYAAAYDAHQVDRQQRPGATEVWSGVWTDALPPAPSEVLDVGTGSGNVALLLAQLGYRVTGIDLAEGMLAEATRKATGPQPPAFVRADAAEPPFAEAAFDAITARYVLWTVRDPREAFARWTRLLRPGGVLVAVDSPWFPDGIGGHENPATARERDFQDAYSAEVLSRFPLARMLDIHEAAGLLKQAGFVDVTVDELPEVLDLDRRYGVAPGHRPQMQYRVRARAPHE